jgi:4-hydroxythreonine-4-phosphate dehydrogenase
MEKAKAIVKSDIEIAVLNEPSDYQEGKLNLISLDVMKEEWEYAKIQASCGRAAFAFIERAIQDALDKKIETVVTGPINKEALNKAGLHYAGMTEIFAEKTNTKDYAMMLTGGPLKVIHVSTHVSVREACNRVKKDRVYTVIKLAEQALRDLGYDNPKIGVAGLNPHAGEHGLFGDEEEKEIEPAIEKARAEGIEIWGPVPPDTVFLHCKNGRYDIVVVMYHDQGHIPLKLLDFMGGVNVTVGIPVVRTSVDHGTVFGKAGKGTVDSTSMNNAILLGRQFAINRG